MVLRVCRSSSTVSRSSIAVATFVLALLATLAGCGSTLKGDPSGGASAAASTPASCAETVLETLGHVVDRVYNEGVSSERTATAQHLISSSAALREAVEAGNALDARRAGLALLASGHMTNLRITVGTRTLIDLGGGALAPVQGTLMSANGRPIGTYLTSVWSYTGFIDEVNGIGEGLVDLRTDGRSLAGSLKIAPKALPAEGTLSQNHVSYRYVSFPAEDFPSGSLRVYLLKPLASTSALCGGTSEDTLVNTLSRVASLIYAGEVGPRVLPQVRRVQRNRPLLEAVARRDPEATRVAIDTLLNQHIVRLRVIAGGRLLSDVGGPYVLAPVQAPLRLNGRTIGSFVLSIQDDEGYLRLARRLAGLDVLMYMGSAHPQLVKNSLGPAPGAVPESGSYSYRGQNFRVYTLHVSAFPSGPLLIKVLIPIPYPAA